jgi:hypothetical protein
VMILSVEPKQVWLNVSIVAIVAAVRSAGKGHPRREVGTSSASSGQT